jgi:hypothetical protein
MRIGIQLRDVYTFLIAPATYELEDFGIPIPVGAYPSNTCMRRRSMVHPLTGWWGCR